MSLCEELKPKQESDMPVNTAIQWLDPIRNQLASDVEVFLARGGKIQQCGTTITSPMVDDAIKYRNEFTGEFDKHRAETIKTNNKAAKAKKNNITSHGFDGKNRAQRKSPFGQNIVRACSKKHGEYFYVQIDGIYHGVEDRLTQKQAIALRDRMRAGRGMPNAEY